MSPHVINAKIDRIAHTDTQLREAESSGLVTDEHRATRRSVVTHAIDNVTPDIVSDRDDGIYVSLKDTQDGGYHVVVTIADVAAHVPLKSNLAMVAHERAFTKYRPWGNDPMFPQELEHRMSLEHQQERLGLNVVMELDKHYQLKSTAFEPVIALPDNVDYAMANDRVKSDAQFAHMNAVSKGIFHHVFGNNMELLKDAAPKHLEEEPSDEKAVEASLMVASYMLLANHAAASFFEATGLPFVYRNFDGTHKSEQGMARAFYDTIFTEHTELEKAGLRGAYCHITSPIRRGADYYNGHMVHYAVQIHDRLAEHLPSEAIWPKMPQILHALYAYQQQPDNATRRALVDELSGIFSRAADAQLVGKLVEELAPMLPPLHPQRLKQSVLEINTLNDCERDAYREEDVRENQKLSERLEIVRGYTAEALEQMDKKSFSSALRNCAKTGELPDVVFREAMQRMRSDKLSKAVDAMHVMVEARPFQEGHWRDLKKAFSLALKDDTTTVNNVLLMAQYYELIDGEKIVLEERQIPLSNNATKLRGLNGREESIHAAIVFMQPSENSPPFYSLGHDNRAAITHANYSFLEHYAFDQLQPLHNAAAPHLLYANLGSKNKKAVLKAVVEPRGGKIISEHRELPPIPDRDEKDRHVVSVVVKGGVFDEMITATAYGESAKDAEQKAYRKMLRKPALKEKAQSITPKQMYQFMHPDEALQEQVREQGWQMDVQMRDESFNSHSNFHCILTIHTDGQDLVYAAHGVNKDRALKAASSMALAQHPDLQVELPDVLERNSWVGNAVRGDDRDAPRSGRG